MVSLPARFSFENENVYKYAESLVFFLCRQYRCAMSTSLELPECGRKRRLDQNFAEQTIIDECDGGGGGHLVYPGSRSMNCDHCKMAA